MIIDAHANIGWDLNNTRKNQFPTGQSHTELLKKMDNYKVDKSIIVPFPSPAAQFNKTNFWYDLENHNLIRAARHSERLIPFAAVNPNDEKSVKNIRTLSISFGIKGVKFSHQTLMKFPIDKLINHALMEIVRDNDLLFMMHIGTGKEPGAKRIHTTLEYAIKVARHYPDIKFIFCHLGRLHWSLLEALNLDNVYTDTAGLSLWQNWRQFIALEPMHIFKSSTPIDVIEELVGKGYEHKIIFGSDEPYTHYKKEIGIIMKAEIPNKSKRKIFYKNIQALLK